MWLAVAVIIFSMTFVTQASLAQTDSRQTKTDSINGQRRDYETVDLSVAIAF